MLNYAKDEGAKDITKAHFLDAGFDLACPKETICLPHRATLIDTGIHVKLEPDEVGFIQPRSSTLGIGLLVVTGTIDAGYTGALKIQVVNLSDYRIEIKEGQRIAQLVVLKNSRAFEAPKLVPLQVITDTNSELLDTRLNKGFGSSGK